jgi:hypothetical protein
MLWIIINVLEHLLQQVGLLKSRNTEDELHFIMDYHICRNHAGKRKFEKIKRIKNFLSGKIEDFLTLFYMPENFQRQGT